MEGGGTFEHNIYKFAFYKQINWYYSKFTNREWKKRKKNGLKLIFLNYFF